MGFDLLDIVWDFLKQSLLFVAAAVLLFLVVSRATNNDLFMQYYAKDTGLAMETLQSGRGDVLLTYDKLVTKPSFNYRFEEYGVLLQLSDVKNAIDWPVRKRYGKDTTTTVENMTLLNPASIIFQKQGAILRAATAASPPITCPTPAAPPPRIATKVLVTGSSPLITPELKGLEESFKSTATPTLTISLKVEQDLAAKPLVVTVPDDPFGNALGCRVAKNIGNSVPSLPVELHHAPPTPQDTTGSTEVLVTHPPAPGLDAAKLRTAFTLALDEVLR
jgi:hypothetical protein